MPRRDPRPRGRRAPGAGAVAVAALVALLGGSIAAPLGRAQPAPEPAIDRAKDLYKSAEAAMKDGRYDDALRDYGAAYELSKDPALFFKIAHANELAGKCDLALVYYARYLHDGKPSEPFVAVTRERIAACGGDVRGQDASTVPADPRPGPGSGGGEPGAGTTAQGAPGAGSATQGSPGTGSATQGSPGAGSATQGAPGTGSADAAGAGSADAATGGASGSPVAMPTPSDSAKAAWILGGGAIALITLGGVLAYAASSSENDVRDLYVGFAGQPPTFDAQTRNRYDDLIDQGHRYQHLSWAAFGLAGATAAGAAFLFVIGGHDESAPRSRVTPLVTTRSAGVAVSF
jgi:hypothetical protein